MLKHRLGNCGCVKYEKTAEVIKEVDLLSENLKNEILGARDEITITGTAYYVAEDGCDDNDGLTVKTPIKSIDKVNTLELKPGVGVFFKRGDSFRTTVPLKSAGITLSAYGSGAKPKIIASVDASGADSGKKYAQNMVSKTGTTERSMPFIQFPERFLRALALI